MGDRREPASRFGGTGGRERRAPRVLTTIPRGGMGGAAFRRP
jgi:hypothetical protein